MALTSFEIEDCELDFGTFCLGGDFSVSIEGDGYEFEVTHVFSCGKRIESPAAIALVKEWVVSDLAKPKRTSRVRREYEDAEMEANSPAAISAARFDHARSLRLEAAE